MQIVMTAILLHSQAVKKQAASARAVFLLRRTVRTIHGMRSP
jgi:hypothetical protein